MSGPGAGQWSTRRLSVLLAAAAVPLVLLPGLFAPPAAAAQPCVGVIVDARLLGGGVSTGCADGDPDTGLDALAAAGFRYAFAPRVPGFVCQIDATPECSRTGPTTYWSYWYRTKGSRTWVYSSAGAGSHDPAPGSTEAWVWQDGGRRKPPDMALASICPQVATSRTARTARPSPSSSSSASPSTSPSSLALSSRSPARTSRSAAVSPSPTTSRPTVTTPAPQPTGSTTGATPSPTTGGVAAGDIAAGDIAAGDRARDKPDRTPWTGVVLGGSLVAALGGAALARSRRSGGRS